MTVVCAGARKTRGRRGTIAVIMNTYRNGFHVMLPALAAFAVLLFGGTGVARVVGWLPDLSDGVGRVVAAEPSTATPATAMPDRDAAISRPAPEGARTRRLCAECGVITAVREVAGDVDPGGSRIRYEFTVRQEDSTHRVITDVNPAAWRVGERVISIGGAEPLIR